MYNSPGYTGSVNTYYDVALFAVLSLIWIKYANWLKEYLAFLETYNAKVGYYVWCGEVFDIILHFLWCIKEKKKCQKLFTTK